MVNCLRSNAINSFNQESRVYNERDSLHSTNGIEKKIIILYNVSTIEIAGSQKSQRYL